MFCRQCGTKISDDSAFCSVCGTKVDDITILNSESGRATWGNPASQKTHKTLLEQMNAIRGIMTELFENESELQYLRDKKDVTSSFFTILLIILVSVFLFLRLFYANLSYADMPLWLTAVLIAAFALNLILSIVLKKKQKAKIERVIFEIAKIQAKEDISWLPSDYRDANIYFKLLSYVENLRASTLSEAINLYELEKQRERIVESGFAAINSASEDSIF